MRNVILYALLAIIGCGTAFGVQATVLYNFGWGDGAWPYGSLIFDGFGNLYGTTSGQGQYDCGTVFKLSPNQDGTWTESVLYNFAGSNNHDGCSPITGLVFDNEGNLYGTTLWGGNPACPSKGCGTVFQVAPKDDGTWTESVILAFGSEPQFGANPFYGVVVDQLGNVYGTASQTIFQLTPHPDGSWEPTVLYSFTGGKDGEFPGGLAIDSSSSLYTLALHGGNNFCFQGCGTVFRLVPQPGGGWTPSVLYSFKGKAGMYPTGTPVLDGSGSLYGATSDDTVFRLTPTPTGHWNHTVIHRFSDQQHGYDVNGNLSFDALGNLYGTTQVGGKFNNGTVFRLSPSGDGGVNFNYFSFDLSDGSSPLAGVVFDQAGNLYGTTVSGGTRLGVAYEITP